MTSCEDNVEEVLMVTVLTSVILIFNYLVVHQHFCLINLSQPCLRMVTFSNVSYFLQLMIQAKTERTIGFPMHRLSTLTSLKKKRTEVAFVLDANHQTMILNICHHLLYIHQPIHYVKVSGSRFSKTADFVFCFLITKNDLTKDIWWL